MALATLRVRSRCLVFYRKARFSCSSLNTCFSENSIISFEAEKGYHYAGGRNMRFSSFLNCELLKFCSRSNHTFQKLLEEANCYGIARISGRLKSINKVSVLTGYDNVQDLLENGNTKGEPGAGLNDLMDESDFLLSCRRFASIVLDSSSPILLYDETGCESDDFLLAQSSHDCLPSSTGRKMVVVEKPRHRWPSSDVISTSEEMSSNLLPLSCEPIASEGEVKSIPKATSEYFSLTSSPEAQQNASTVDMNLCEPIEMILDKPLNNILGITSKRRSRLEKCGFHTLRQLLHHFPKTYADMRNAQSGVDDGDYLIFVGKVLVSKGVRGSASFSFLEVVVSCDIANDGISSEHKSDSDDSETKRTIYLHLKKFFSGARFTNKYFLRSMELKHKDGDFVCVTGKVKASSRKDHFEMTEYNIDIIEDEKDSSTLGGEIPYPLYPSKGGLSRDFLKETISRALKSLSVNIDPIPNYIREQFNIPSLHSAYIGIHNPKTLNEADLARKRFLFDEFFYLQLGRLFQMLEPLGTQIEKEGLLDNFRKENLSGTLMEEWSSLAKKLLAALPYSLTSSQLKAVAEIIWDLKRPVPMNRLLQGDVGCGKTVVSFLACMEVIGSGYQAAYMVPTELLALQHYEHLLSLLQNIEESCRPSIALLMGSTPTRQSRAIREGLKTGDISLVIGTHSLIAESIEYSALRIAVVDEQHRFGVIQRGMFNSKLYSANLKVNTESKERSSENEVLMAPHILAMSATPIPRSLALALYGDMSLTQITDIPPGRKPVKTYIFEGSNKGLENVYQMMLEELSSEGKVYVVYPIIEASEQLPQLRAASSDLEIMSRTFDGYRCGLLHGKMKSDEKDEALQRFRSGETQILLSTQVIECGVDVPDASMMVVMNAERFGIAQLHQLRGRVGRGVKESKCIFVVSSASGLKRLKMLEKSSDGFHLAKVDLLLRGPGDLLGKKQSGHIPEFPIARLEIDGNIIEEAHLAALKILSISHTLERFPMLKVELSMRHPLCLLGD